MKIQAIHSINTKSNFTQNQKRSNVDRAVTVQDLYEFEDRLNSRIDSQNKILGQTLYSLSDLVYKAPYMINQDQVDFRYQESLYYSEKLKNLKS